MENLKLPVGIDNFEKLRRENFYYVDKTKLIIDLLGNWGEVNLFTRPRRFGKTLNLSMLKYFFEIGTDKTLFDGLAVSKEKALCDEHMGKYPIVFLSLSSVDGLSFEAAYNELCRIIRKEASRLRFLSKNESIPDVHKVSFDRILNGNHIETDVRGSLKMLCNLLYAYYGQKVILIIDEYDVPLIKSSQHGYYEQMSNFIHSMYGTALKTNEYLKFAVLTGSQRVPDKSIFNGLNNFDVNSILDTRYDEHFGFTDEEVRQTLADYGSTDHFEDTKAWYGGYRFGNAEVYCPWDVINYVDLLKADHKTKPPAYLINTSGNDLVKRFVDKAGKTTQGEIERLINGEAIEKKVRLELTYNEIDDTIDNLWSVLFTTGYLTYDGETDDGKLRLIIPNHEVREVFILQIQEWFKKTFVRNDKPMRDFCQAFMNGDAEVIQKHLNLVMTRMISVLDTKAKDDQKENFYHGLLLWLLRSDPTWLIMSNVESGDGFSDIIIEPDDQDAGIVIEVKYAPTIAELDAACKNALNQIKERRYDERLRNEGRENNIGFGIAFCKKRCRVVCEKL